MHNSYRMPLTDYNMTSISEFLIYCNLLNLLKLLNVNHKQQLVHHQLKLFHLPIE